MSMVLDATPEGAAANAGASAGLNLGQKIGAANRALPKPRTHHPYIVGLSLIVIGGFALIGSITGALPSMLAALFVPDALVDSAGNSGDLNAPSLGSTIAGTATNAAGVGIGFLGGAANEFG